MSSEERRLTPAYACIAHRQGDLDEPLVPAVTQDQGLRIDYAAMTPSFLVTIDKVSREERLSVIAVRLLDHLRAGGTVRLLLSNALALGLWSSKKPSIEPHAARRADHVHLFMTAARQAKVDHRVEVRTHDWVASMGMTKWDGPDGAVWICPYTFAPEAAANDKMHIRFAADSPPGTEYCRQFDAMWVKAQPFEAKPSRREVRAIERRARTLVVDAAKRAGRHADLAVVIALTEEYRYFRDLCASWFAGRDEEPQWRTLEPDLYEIWLPSLSPGGSFVSRRVLVHVVGQMGRAEAGSVT